MSITRMRVMRSSLSAPGREGARRPRGTPMRTAPTPRWQGPVRRSWPAPRSVPANGSRSSRTSGPLNNLARIAVPRGRPVLKLAVHDVALRGGVPRVTRRQGDGRDGGRDSRLIGRGRDRRDVGRLHDMGLRDAVDVPCRVGLNHEWIAHLNRLDVREGLAVRGAVAGKGEVADLAGHGRVGIVADAQRVEYTRTARAFGDGLDVVIAPARNVQRAERGGLTLLAQYRRSVRRVHLELVGNQLDECGRVGLCGIDRA